MIVSVRHKIDTFMVFGLSVHLMTARVVPRGAPNEATQVNQIPWIRYHAALSGIVATVANELYV